MGGASSAASMPKGDRPIVLYPAYFDLGRSREEGRRVAKKWAVESPTAQEVTAAAKALGLQPQLEEGKAFPSTPWRKEGRVLVRADYYKTSIVQKVARRIKEARQTGSAVVLARPDILDETLPRRDEVDGVDDGAQLPERVLDARIVDRRAFDRDLDVLRVLVDFVERAAHAIHAFECRETERHLDEGRFVGLQNVQDDSLDVAQRVAAPETVSTGTFDNKRSLASPGCDFRAGGSHDHRVLGLRHDSAANVQQGWVRHHGPGAYEPIQQGGRVSVEAVRPSLRERERLELRRENLQKAVQRRLFHRLRLEDPINVAGPAAVHFARAGRRERFDRDDLAGVEGVVTMPDVRHALARVQQVPLNRVAGEVADGTKPVRFDCPLDPLAEGSREHATLDRLDRRL